MKHGIELLNCDDHQGIINKMGKSFEDYRPDVTHQVNSLGSMSYIVFAHFA